MRTVAKIMGCWPTDADFARDIGLKPKHAQTMQARNSIPPAYWKRVVDAAARRDIKGITLELLAELAEEKLAS